MTLINRKKKEKEIRRPLKRHKQCLICETSKGVKFTEIILGELCNLIGVHVSVPHGS